MTCLACAAWMTLQPTLLASLLLHNWLRGDGRLVAAVLARAKRAGLRRRRPTLLARTRLDGKQGLEKREGKIKGAARDLPRRECSCGFAAARAFPRTCRALRVDHPIDPINLAAPVTSFDLAWRRRDSF